MKLSNGVEKGSRQTANARDLQNELFRSNATEYERFRANELRMSECRVRLDNCEREIEQIHYQMKEYEGHNEDLKIRESLQMKTLNELNIKLVQLNNINFRI